MAAPDANTTNDDDFASRDASSRMPPTASTMIAKATATSRLDSATRGGVPR